MNGYSAALQVCLLVKKCEALIQSISSLGVPKSLVTVRLIPGRQTCIPFPDLVFAYTRYYKAARHKRRMVGNILHVSNSDNVESVFRLDEAMPLLSSEDLC